MFFNKHTPKLPFAKNIYFCTKFGLFWYSVTPKHPCTILTITILFFLRINKCSFPYTHQKCDNKQLKRHIKLFYKFMLVREGASFDYHDNI